MLGCVEAGLSPVGALLSCSVVGAERPGLDGAEAEVDRTLYLVVRVTVISRVTNLGSAWLENPSLVTAAGDPPVV